MVKRAIYSSSPRRQVSQLTRQQLDFTPVVDPPKPPSKLRLKFKKIYGTCKRYSTPVTFAILFGLLGYTNFKPLDTQLRIDRSLKVAFEKLSKAPGVATAAYEKIAPSVVRVVQKTDPKNPNHITSVGTGTIFDKSGLILTNSHVVGKELVVEVQDWQGRTTLADVMKNDPEKDIAVLMMQEVPADTVPAVMAASTESKVGDEVIAVGYPFGFPVSVSSGVISGFHRVMEEKGGAALSGLIQFDAAANPGNSGGPLVNKNGEFIGIVTAIFNPDGRHFAGMAFAITLEDALSGGGEESPF
jgi:S1-C subfamily serine protease